LFILQFSTTSVWKKNCIKWKLAEVIFSYKNTYEAATIWEKTIIIWSLASQKVLQSSLDKSTFCKSKTFICQTFSSFPSPSYKYFAMQKKLYKSNTSFYTSNMSVHTSASISRMFVRFSLCKSKFWMLASISRIFLRNSLSKSKSTYRGSNLQTFEL